MTVNELYRCFLKELSLIYPEHEASNITSIIFEHFAGLTRSSLIINPHLILNDEIITLINESLGALKSHKPVQYITGEAWFYKMKLTVSPAVLIPRPETEELVEKVIDFLKSKPISDVLDIGTGSGCIAIAIKKNVPETRITAIDIRHEALAIATQNAKDQHTDINFLQVDFLTEQTWNRLEKYNVIVSNPPYIPENELKRLDKNVSDYEPHIALFVNQPLIFYEKIEAFCRLHLDKNGAIFMETHEDYAQDVSILFTNEFYTCVITVAEVVAPSFLATFITLTISPH